MSLRKIVMIVALSAVASSCARCTFQVFDDLQGYKFGPHETIFRPGDRARVFDEAGKLVESHPAGTSANSTGVAGKILLKSGTAVIVVDDITETDMAWFSDRMVFIRVVEGAARGRRLLVTRKNLRSK